MKKSLSAGILGLLCFFFYSGPIWAELTENPALSVTPAFKSVDRSSGNTTFIVSNTGTGILTWSAAVVWGDDWLTISNGSSGSGAGIITCQYGTNTGDSSRAAVIRITAANAPRSPIDVNVTQMTILSSEILGAFGSLKVISGQESEIDAGTDISGDGKIGLPEAIYSLQMFPVEHIVTFKDHDGKVLETEIVSYGKGATAPTAPTRIGYTFTGWDKAFTNVTGNLTVTAQYNKIPTAPTNVFATDGTYSDKVKITWTASSSATSYEVWQSSSNNSSTAVRLGNTSNTYFYSSSGTAGTKYYYWVKAKNSSGTSGFSSSDSGYKKKEDSPLVGTWGVIDESYYIYFDVEADGSITNVYASLPAQKTTYNYGTLTVTLDNFTSTTIDTHTYSFSVSKSEEYNYGWNERSINLDATFYNTDGVIWVAVDWTATDLFTPEKYISSGTVRLDKIDLNDDDTPPPLAPEGVSATDGQYGDKVKITWEASPTATSYEIWRSTSNSTSSATKIGTAMEIYYDDYDADTEQIYYYWVKAKNGGGAGNFSRSDTGYKIDPPSAPEVDQTASTDNPLGIEIKWYASDRAESYEVWRSKELDSSSAILIATTTDTSYFNSNNFDFGGGTFYYYWIKAKNSAGKSDFSLTIFGRVKPIW